MMIFSLTLTANQMQILRAVATEPTDPCPRRDGTMGPGLPKSLSSLRHLIAGTKTLCNEGLLHFHNPGFTITEKGKLVLQLVEMDVRKFLEDIEAPKDARADKDLEPKPSDGKKRRPVAVA